MSGVFVKTPVFPFVRFPGVDTILGPEMKSTGEVMGGAATFGAAFAKAQQSVGQHLPEKGTAFISVNNDDKPNVLPIARNLADLGFRILASRGTAAYLRAHGIPVEVVFKVNEGRPNVADHILNNQIQLIVNTPLGRESFFDDRVVRRVAMLHNIPCITTLTGASAAVEAIRALREPGARRARAAGLSRGDDGGRGRGAKGRGRGSCLCSHRARMRYPAALPARRPRRRHHGRHLPSPTPFIPSGSRLLCGWRRSRRFLARRETLATACLGARLRCLRRLSRRPCRRDRRATPLHTLFNQHVLPRRASVVRRRLRTPPR